MSRTFTIEREMEFDGDIIITDPCYIIRKESRGIPQITDDDWEACDYGDNMEVLGINHYMTKDTIYGDWGCTTINTDTDEEIGSFCADAGLVSVFLLDEILKYNPDFNYHLNRPWTTTWIKSFKGTVQFVIVKTEGAYDSDFILDDGRVVWRKGDAYEALSLEVVGHGVNTVTGEPINFVGKQTSL